VYNWLNPLQNQLFPPTCLLCGHAGYAQRECCGYCWQQLPRNVHYCQRCAEPFFDATDVQVCERCRYTPPCFDYAYAPFLYQDALRYLITALKYRAAYPHARLLGQLLAEAISDYRLPLPELILPIPLHRRRYRQRGFNQSIEIARTLSKQLAIPLDLYSCQRQCNTPQQARLSFQQRQDNMLNAFALVKPLSITSVAIVDDVLTTGATANALARVLKEAGVPQVMVWVCARA
jgi:ComF family protein